MEIAAAIVAFLGPYLKQLLDPTIEDAGQHLNDAADGLAKRLWAKLRPKVDERDAIREAAEDVAEAPQDEDAHAALRQQLRKLLAADPDLATELETLWREGEQQRSTHGITVTASGTRAVAGVNVTGTTVTGDHNTIVRPDNVT